MIVADSSCRARAGDEKSDGSVSERHFQVSRSLL
jgi:hypothetical protein